MAKEANRMMIGGFVVVAVFLLAASIVIFGSGRFFKETDTYVLHFDKSIKGLNVGAPVLFQGVQVGSVSKIILRADRENLTMDIPVYIQIEQDRFQVVGKQLERRPPRETLPILIDKGMRAMLALQNFITGQLMIELDFFPKTPVNLKGTDHEYLEIPTIPSTTERLFETLHHIDFQSLAEHLESTLVGVDKFVNNPDIFTGLKALRVTAEELQDVIGKVDNDLEMIIANVEGTFKDASTLINNLDRQVAPLAVDVKKTIDDFDKLTLNANSQMEKLAGNLEKSLLKLRGVVSEDAPMIVQMEETIEDISLAANAIRQLAIYLEQHPESLIQGKDNYGGK